MPNKASPAYRRQRSETSDRAFIELDGVRHYLGKFDSPESQEYHRLTALPLSFRHACAECLPRPTQRAKAAHTGAFASDSILPIVAEFENPQHEVFRERTAWSLYNACTERMKGQSPGHQVDGYKALNQVLVAELN